MNSRSLAIMRKKEDDQYDNEKCYCSLNVICGHYFKYILVIVFVMPTIFLILYHIRKKINKYKKINEYNKINEYKK